MHNLPLKLPQPGDVGITRLIQLPDCRDQKITLNRIALGELRVLAPRDLNLNPPLLRLIIPSRRLNSTIKPYVLIQLILIRHVP
jgi:hypothetical protein